MFYDWKTFWQSNVTGIFTHCIIHYILLKLISRKDKRQHWKCVNISTSFIHSILSSIIGLYLFIENPVMCTTDIVFSFTKNAYSFISFEMGYFIFDSIDNIKNFSGRQTYEVLLHHIIVLGCFSIAIYYGRYIGYCVISLYVEMNSIFLHFRQLLLFWNIPKQDKIYQINNIINFSTFILFRFCIVFYMFIQLFLNRSNIPFIIYFIGHSGFLMLTIINFHLLYRLLKSDYHESFSHFFSDKKFKSKY